MKNKGQINIEMADLIGKTYFKVATWNNTRYNDDEEKQESLKSVSAEIIQMILEDTFQQMSESNKMGVKIVNEEKEGTLPVSNITPVSSGYSNIIVNTESSLGKGSIFNNMSHSVVYKL